MMFGKYKDKTYTEVLSVDPQYCEWCKTLTLQKQEAGATPTLEMARFVRWLDRYHTVSRQAQRLGQQNVSVDSDWEVIYREMEVSTEQAVKKQPTRAEIEHMYQHMALDYWKKQQEAQAAAPAASAGGSSSDVTMTGVRPILLSPGNSKKSRGDGQLPALPEGAGDDL